MLHNCKSHPGLGLQYVIYLADWEANFGDSDGCLIQGKVLIKQVSAPLYC